MHTEDLGHAADAVLHVRDVADENARVLEPYLAAGGADCLADAAHQRFKEIRPVQALQKYFTIANQNQFTHCIVSSIHHLRVYALSI